MPSRSDLEWVAVGELEPWDRNPRHNDEAVKAVADSISRFGFGAPIVARREGRRIIAGHTRLRAAQSAGLDQVPVRWMDISDADATALALADNRLAEIATWDDEGLADILAELSEEFDADAMNALGWSVAELSDLLSGADFEPEPDAHQGELDKIKPYQCPHCGEPVTIEDLRNASK